MDSTLVLGRKVGQKILIGPDPYQIELTVTRIENGQVSLRFTGSADVPIDRWEIAERKGLLPADRV